MAVGLKFGQRHLRCFQGGLFLASTEAAMLCPLIYATEAVGSADFRDAARREPQDLHP